MQYLLKKNFNRDEDGLVSLETLSICEFGGYLTHTLVNQNDS